MVHALEVVPFEEPHVEPQDIDVTPAEAPPPKRAARRDVRVTHAKRPHALLGGVRWLLGLGEYSEGVPWEYCGSIIVGALF